MKSSSWPRVGRPSGSQLTISPVAVLPLADDGGDVLGLDAVEVQVQPAAGLDCGPWRLWERLSGPRQPWLNHGL
jgi:hypothetical protein